MAFFVVEIIMSRPFLRFHQVSFTYSSAPEPIFEDVSLHIAHGWSGVVGANGTGKSTLLKLSTGLLDPDSGQIDHPPHVMYCQQRTDDIPEQFDAFIRSETKESAILKNLMVIKDDWINRWETVSHGERKRVQIALALWLEPEILALDEPTNHIDSEARDIISNALCSFQGVGLLVSHDRELLDTLCRECLFMEPPKVIVRPGGITKGMQIAQFEHASLEKQYKLRKRTFKKLKKESTRRRRIADQSQKRRSKRGLAKKDHDGREKLDRARISGKDGVGGKLLRQMDGRLKQAQKHLEAVHIKKDYTLGIGLPGAFSKRNFLLELPTGSMGLGEEKKLHYPELLIKPNDRIAISGPNGSGKSTLIRFIIKKLNAPKDRITYIPQEIDASQSQNILARARDLPKEGLGYLMTIVSRLGSRPHRLLSSTQPSPGETRKLLLALGMTYTPHIIVMDEPTNHMDLPSIECLEEALQECTCSLLLVSHDKRFLENLTEKSWWITREMGAKNSYHLMIN